MPTGRATKKLDTTKLGVEKVINAALPEQTLQAMLDAFEPFIPGMIQSLGIASQPVLKEDGSLVPGDLDAAKKALDFLSKAMSGTKAEGRGADVLRKIQEIRASATDAD